jgi:microcystin-dependent protein
MSDQYVGEIRAFGCNFAPYGWAPCDGQLMSISQNSALFSLLGINYGGDGRSTFALPNLQGRAALNQDQSPGGKNEYRIGQTGGAAAVTLTTAQMAAHNHTALAATASTAGNPSGLTWANPGGRTAPNYFANAVGTAQVMNPQALQLTGGNQPHNNLMPYQVVNFCIALQGIFPQRP